MNWTPIKQKSELLPKLEHTQNGTKDTSKESWARDLLGFKNDFTNFTTCTISGLISHQAFTYRVPKLVHKRIRIRFLKLKGWFQFSFSSRSLKTRCLICKNVFILFRTYLRCSVPVSDSRRMSNLHNYHPIRLEWVASHHFFTLHNVEFISFCAWNLPENF